MKCQKVSYGLDVTKSTFFDNLIKNYIISIIKKQTLSITKLRIVKVTRNVLYKGIETDFLCYGRYFQK